MFSAIQQIFINGPIGITFIKIIKNILYVS